MNGAIAPLSTQMQQEKEKYKNAANSVGECPLLRKLRNPDMVQILKLKTIPCTKASCAPDFGA
ncbi:hypothetical protein J2X19_002895 [Rhodoferax ferrireducens]|uniref:Uncharacterized protein n=2 Tax=Rhodoferax TaxID=28065 RepID=A0ABU2CA58_9BURK|nr:hypothetical protein [Rhodoferax ferrireducens]MDR7378216.1 hypothetical protein [Rhodoferax ferrireducens]